MDIKPIETVYNGYRFRSRLEARWAVFFDAAGIKYEYEPEGFEYGPIDSKYYYLPDFYLPELNKYVEVKGSKEALLDDFRKIASSIDWDATPIAKCGLLILGQIPNYEKIGWGNVPMFTYLFRGNKCVNVEHAIFWEIYGGEVIVIGNNDRIISTLYSYESDYIDAGFSDIPKFITTEEMYTHKSLRSYDPIRMNKLIKCFRIARQARFEHGETPQVKEVTYGT